MPHKTVQYCSRCGRAFREGRTRYIVTVHIVSDFDGHLADVSSRERAEMWKEIEHKSEEELTEEVVQNFSFVLCKPCRDAWGRSPLGTATEDSDASTTNVH